ncbi:YhcG family protein [Parasegetibacter sp. NRK P23]|uniref:PDDEXK nuclease domain-containing protein n=1 Tax=Parasegetibacter sp. NRK P23 TaxID=2942999 RepID=UPI0020445835|nr:PDDEXK nuclease domain-containing protein [Parasegetibacter sp. NRK P23]MCM5530524.1 PDDEXK nuclease domain-containing protein [Parasegetibacter sp. NRK P23]
MTFDRTQYSKLVANISDLVATKRSKIAQQINNEILNTYWHIGKYIIDFEQDGKLKAEYGAKLLLELSKELTIRLGKGFSRSNLHYMRAFYVAYPICETLSHKLGWSHYYELLKINDGLERQFYEKQSEAEGWSVRELKRHKSTALYQRIALSKDKEGVLALSKEGHKVKDFEDIIKDPYVLEFLNIPEDQRLSERHLEQKIIDNLQNFLLELGKGFAFIGRQQRVTVNNTHHYIDLVFYHRILKCFVLIDLKIDEVAHHDIGQMNLYLNYYEIEQNVEGDNPPIGIILSAHKDDIFVEYAIRGITNKIFISKYQLYLPDKELLQQKVRDIIDKD